ncbi:MAG: hypothetical protein ACREQR_01965, partial [Candidatus Binataceae bacterium]
VEQPRAASRPRLLTIIATSPDARVERRLLFQQGKANGRLAGRVKHDGREALRPRYLIESTVAK